jgi:hypothetical protein
MPAGVASARGRNADSRNCHCKKNGAQCVVHRYRGLLNWRLCWVSSPLIVKIPKFLAWPILVVWCGHISANFAELDCPRIEYKPIHSADKVSCGFWLKQRPFKSCGTAVNINKDLINRPRELPLTNDVRKVRAKRSCACPFRLRREIVIGTLAEARRNFVGIGRIEGFDISPYDMLDTLSSAEFIRHGVLLARFSWSGSEDAGAESADLTTVPVLPIRRYPAQTRLTVPRAERRCESLGPVVNYPGSACGFESVPSSLRLSGVLAVSPNCHSARSIDTGRRIAGSGAAPPSIHRRSASWRLTDAAVWTA